MKNNKEKSLGKKIADLIISDETKELKQDLERIEKTRIGEVETISGLCKKCLSVNGQCNEHASGNIAVGYHSQMVKVN